MSLSKKLQPLAAMFRPPFEGLWLAALLYFAWSYAVYPDSAILRGDLPDTDDYMYLNQVLDWLNGQGWYDNVQHRLDPPHGVPIHFSRLAQIPMAALVLLFRLLGLGPKGAAMLMALVYPIVLLGGFFAALRWLMQSFVPRDWAGVSPYVALFSTGVMYMFRPGHIDHHGLDVILTALALGCAFRMFERPQDYRWGLYAGLIMALAQTVALEVLPWLMLLSAALGLWGAVRGGPAARNGFGYALALAAASAAFLLLTRPPEDLPAMDVLTYSAVYVILTGGILASFAGLALTANAPVWLRMGLGGAIAAVTGYLFLRHFPELAGGPYGGIDPALAQIILGEMTEALPFKMQGDGWLKVSRVTMGPVFAVAANVWFLARAPREERWRWGTVLVLLLAALGLSVFYQRRFVATLGLLTIIPLTVALARGWGRIGELWRGRARSYAEIALLLLVGPLPSVIYPALSDGRSFNKGVLLFPVSDSGTPCEMFALENLLRDKAYYGDRPRLIMAPIGEGPELLFRTGHSALAAPYHMDIDGNVDSMRFFSTPYPSEAREILRRRRVDLVVACRAIPEVYLRKTMERRLAQGDDLKDFAPHFITRLMNGNVPDWLRPVSNPATGNYVVYEVRVPETP